MCRVKASCVFLVIIINALDVQSHKECGVLDSGDGSPLPWVANIYQSDQKGGYDFICSGTVVSRKIILTAAHCFYDDLTQQIRDVDFVVVAGQPYKTWDPQGYKNSQIREISHGSISIKKQYKGSAGNYASNIAIVRLNKDQKLNMNSYVQRACVYWDNDFVESEFETNRPLLKVVVGGKEASDALKFVEASFVEFDTCLSLVPKQFQSLLTFDKLCGQIDGKDATSDMGSGLYVKDSAKGRWYLIGIASDSLSSNGTTYIAFTKLQTHLNWISNNAFLHV